MASPAEIAALKNYPLQPPPSGQSSNFNKPTRRGPTFIALVSFSLVIMWPILILRLYSKVRVIRRFWWDDGKPDGLRACCLLKFWHSLRHLCGSLYYLSQIVDGSSSEDRQLGVTGLTANFIWCINAKVYAPHQWDVRAIWLTPQAIKLSAHCHQRILFDRKRSQMEILGAGLILLSLTMICTRLALFSFYYRMFVVKRWTRITIYFGIIHTFLFYSACIVFVLVICIPRRDES